MADKSNYSGYRRIDCNSRYFNIFTPKEGSLADKLHVIRGNFSIVLGESGKDLVELAKTYMAGPVVVDMQDVPNVDKAGLHSLISSYTAVALAGNKLTLCNASKRVEDLLKITLLDNVFQPFTSLNEAVGECEANLRKRQAAR
jgi:anti-anti-sigma factor